MFCHEKHTLYWWMLNKYLIYFTIILVVITCIWVSIAQFITIFTVTKHLDTNLIIIYVPIGDFLNSTHRYGTYLSFSGRLSYNRTYKWQTCEWLFLPFSSVLHHGDAEDLRPSRIYSCIFESTQCSATVHRQQVYFLDWTSIWGCKPQVQTNWTVELYYLITSCIFLINLWLHDIQICIFWKNLPNRYRPLNLYPVKHGKHEWLGQWMWVHCPLAARRAFHTLSISNVHYSIVTEKLHGSHVGQYTAYRACHQWISLITDHINICLETVQFDRWLFS